MAPQASRRGPTGRCPGPAPGLHPALLQGGHRTPRDQGILSALRPASPGALCVQSLYPVAGSAESHSREQQDAVYKLIDDLLKLPEGKLVSSKSKASSVPVTSIYLLENVVIVEQARGKSVFSDSETRKYACVCVCVCARVRACMRVCVRACANACVRSCVKSVCVHTLIRKRPSSGWEAWKEKEQEARGRVGKIALQTVLGAHGRWK